jgi:gamma-glutamyl-gamma-aminobutyrate hydrolase PuuD
MKKKIFVVGGAIYYADWIENYELVDNLTEANVVLFTGGEDVNPAFYGEEDPRDLCFCNYNRDEEEANIFEKVKPDQVCLGICRGSQFLCSMNGGKLVQDCTNHAIGFTHGIINDKGVCYDITSTHHQMQYPYNMDSKNYDVLYISTTLRSRYYIGGSINSQLIQEYGEPEIVLYHVPSLPKCLAIQGHPEMMFKDAPVIKMLNELLDSVINNK